MFMIKKGEIREVRIVSVEDNEYNVFDVKSEITIVGVKKEQLYKNYIDCEMALKEMKVKKAFKKVTVGKNGKHTCSWCKRKGKDLTVDHIVPLDYFGGKKKIRKDIDLWNRAWRFSNLQILCEECNKRKDNFVDVGCEKSLNDIDFFARKLNNRRVLEKNKYKNTPLSKIGFGIATGKWSNNKKEMADYVAKADSNILRLDMILLNQEAYDTLPSTI